VLKQVQHDIGILNCYNKNLINIFRTFGLSRLSGLKKMALPSNLTSSRLYAGFIVCGLVWTGLQTYVVHSFGFNWYAAFTDGLVCAILLASACWLINNNLRYYQPEKGNYLNILPFVHLEAGGYCRFWLRALLIPSF
jgi:two-component system LytT family sensor kinase